MKNVVLNENCSTPEKPKKPIKHYFSTNSTKWRQKSDRIYCNLPPKPWTPLIYVRIVISYKQVHIYYGRANFIVYLREADFVLKIKNPINTTIMAKFRLVKDKCEAVCEFGKNLNHLKGLQETHGVFANILKLNWFKTASAIIDMNKQSWKW